MHLPFNPMPDGTSRTVKSQYYKNGFLNLVCTKGTHAATGVMTVYEHSTEHD